MGNKEKSPRACELLHGKKLHELSMPEGLTSIDERPYEIRVMFTEPKYFRDGFHFEYKCPDLFLNYKNGLWTVIELKHSYSEKHKAFKQIKSGIEMLVDVFGAPYEDIRGKFVTYENNSHFYFEEYKRHLVNLNFEI